MHAVLFAALLMAAPQAEAAPPPTPAAQPTETAAPAGTEPASSFVLGLLKASTHGARTLPASCDSGYDKPIPEESVVFVVAVTECRKPYGSDAPVTFYEIAWRGETYFVPAEKVFLAAEQRRRLESLTEAQWPEVREQGLDGSKYVYSQALGAAVSDMKSKARLGIAIASWAVVDESEYTDGTGLRFTVYNPTKKAIKYVRFDVQGLNRVDDPVGGVKTVRGVGPIDPDSTDALRFEYVWMTDLVDSARIRRIRVQYMDGSTKEVPAAADFMLDKATAALLDE